MTFDIPDRAFAGFEEPLKWTQDAAPHMSGVIRGVVLHGAPDSQSAGNPLGVICADTWTVHVRKVEALCDRVAVGDTIRRIGVGAEVLTVQQIARDEFGWLLNCTANERGYTR